MNHKDIKRLIEEGKIPAPPKGDMLELIFERQNQLIDKYHPIEKARGAHVVEREMFGQLDHRFLQWRLKDVIGERCVEEIHEAMNTLRNKPWAQNDTLTDVDHFFDEIADALHFFVEGCITAGMDAQQLFYLYYLKSEVNKFRLGSGY